MCDPDAPSPDHPKYRSWLHWIVANIPAKDPERGEEIMPYTGPASYLPLTMFSNSQSQ